MTDDTGATLFRQVDVYDSAAISGKRGPLDVLIRGRAIAEIAARIEPPRGANVVDGRNKLLMPGLVNGHFHSSVNHMKGRLPCLPLEMFMLYESPSLPVLTPTPREAYLRTMLAGLEMIRCGTTAVQDDAFFVPDPTPEIIDAVAQAYADLGIRATLALDQPEVAEITKFPFLADLVPDDIKAELAQSPRLGRRDLLALYDHLIQTWHGHDHGRIRAAASCSAPQRVTPEYFADLNDLSRAHDMPLYVHILETRLQRVLGQECFGGRSLVRYVADLGLLSPRMNIIHAIWVDDADLDLIAASGAVVAHNPISNLRLGSGVMPFRKMRQRNIPICLGTDEAIADDATNMWNVIKLAGMIHTMAGGDYEDWPQAREILDCCIEGGARAMGQADHLGAVAVGRTADLILIDLATLAFTPLNDLPRQLVHCETGGSVTMTMVDGRILYNDGRLLSVDEPALLSEARELFAARAPALAAAAEAMNRFAPYYRAMLAKAEACDVGMNRRLGH